jgi:hypothetical protein
MVTGRANNFCFFVRPGMAWCKSPFAHQAKFAEEHVISKSRCRYALALTENRTIIPMNFQVPILFAICCSSNLTFATDRLCAETHAF